MVWFRRIRFAVSTSILLIGLSPHLASADQEPKTGEEIFTARLVMADVARVTLDSAKIQLKVLDREVKVVLHLPADRREDPRVYALWNLLDRKEPSDENSALDSVCCRLFFKPARVQILPSSTATVIDLTVGLSEPLAKIVTEIVRGLFPQTTTRSDLYSQSPSESGDSSIGPDSPPCTERGSWRPGEDELRMQLEMAPRLVEKQGAIPVVKRLEVDVKLTIADRVGRIVDVFEDVGTAEVDGITSFAITGPWEAAGEEALIRAADQLLRNLGKSEKLSNCLKNLAEPRSLPAGLVVTAQLDDAPSLLPNGRLDAGEEALFVVHVENRGPGPAFQVAVQAGSDRPEITVAGDRTVGDLAPGEKKDVVLRVTGGLGLPSGVAKLRVEAVEKRGYGSRPVEVELAASQMVAPQLEIVDITLNDRGGRATGDGDGQPGNGESIEAVVRVRNAGPGEGTGVAVTMASPKVRADVVESKVVLPRIAAGRVEEARFLFRLPMALEARELSLVFQAVDARGAQVGSASREQVWPIRTKRPGIMLGIASYDGKSAGSSGNRDGEANNGERIELVVAPANRGELAARGVRIAVEPEDGRLKAKPAVLEVGDLPAEAEGAAQRFVLDIPRDYGLDRPAGEMRLTLMVSQKDFPPRPETMVLRFRPLRPELVLEPEAPVLTRSSQGELFLRLRNAGALRAEDVVLEVSTEAAGVDLLDDRRVPGRSRRIAVGALDPQAAAPSTAVPIQIRRNAALGTASLRVTVTQKGFPSLVRDVPLAVNEETAELIPFRPTEDAARAAEPVSPVTPAMIAFLSHTEGQHLLQEAINLRFEIQSPGELSDVRLMRNDRRISLDGAESSRSTTPGLRGMAYQLPVQLEDGENRFEVVVVTQQGLKTARSLTLFRDHEVGRVWVVAIGISKYQDPSIPALRYADADARAIYDYFRARLPESQVFLLVNEAATLRGIKSLLGTQLVAKAFDPKDTVILYFAGHGMRDHTTRSLDPYFLSYDAQSGDLYSSAFEMNEVTDLLRRLIPDRAVVLIDSCFSGAVGGRSPYEPKSEGKRALFSDEFLDRMAHAGSGRAVLAASGPDEVAQEDPDLGHGIFTYHLLGGLRGAADSIPQGEITPDGNITILELYKYISSKVNKATGGKQTPMLKAPELAGEILVTEGASGGGR
jgi:uncharacterized caspase-like protein